LQIEKTDKINEELKLSYRGSEPTHARENGKSQTPTPDYDDNMSYGDMQLNKIKNSFGQTF